MPDDRFKQPGFRCPHCGNAAQQNWRNLSATVIDPSRVPTPWLPQLHTPPNMIGTAESPAPPTDTKARAIKLGQGRRGTFDYQAVENLTLSQCYTCREVTVWVADDIVVPRIEVGKTPHPDLPEVCKADFVEACAVAEASPRAAAALLRACMEKLLGEITGKTTPDEAIRHLLLKGLDASVQQAMDVLRVTGNKALHGYEIAEDEITAAPTEALIGLLNIVVEDRITKPAKLEALYLTLPEVERAKIAKRNAKVLPT